MNNYEEEFEQMINRLKQKNALELSNVVKAYEFAKQKHANQYRKSGKPYILHPVEVAMILEKLNFNTDVISAALLHDTVEDCGVTIEEIKQNFNNQIAEIVDAVTAITKDNFMPNDEDIFLNPDNFLKLAIEDKTYQKLISYGKSNKFGFYIKFADRLNNLQTIDVFQKYKQEAKVNETKKWIIPLAKILKSKYFYRHLTNECFKINFLDKSKSFFNFYGQHFKSLASHMQKIKNLLVSEINSYIKSYKLDVFLHDIVLEQKTQLEMFENISSHFEIKNIEKIKASNLIAVPSYNIYIILSESKQSKNHMQLLYDFFERNFSTNYFKIVNFDFDIFGNPFLVVKDNLRNLFDITCVTKRKYTKIQNGTTMGSDIEIVDETIANEIVTDYITVLTRSNQKLKIPANSTVLDFAFKLHNDIGFSCKFAYINDSPIKSPIYTKLNEYDKVEIICEQDLNGFNKNIAELRWLAYCKNETTQRILIKFFEKKYNV